MGKNKIARWAELGSFENVIQPETGEVREKDHPVRGTWNRNIFKNENPLILELGCGKGEYTVGLSQLFPESNFIGVDIKGARLWRGAKTAFENQHKNAWFLRTRIEFISRFFGSGEIDEILIIFPDPHPGKRNSNKRLTCPWFLNIYSDLLKENGVIHLKTDNRELYNYTKSLAEENGLEILFSTNNLHLVDPAGFYLSEKMIRGNNDPGFRARIASAILKIRTHYEEMFLEKGLTINYLVFRLAKGKTVFNGWENSK